MLLLRVRLDLVAMAMKGYSAIPKAPALLEPRHQIVQCYIQNIRWGCITSLQRSNWFILQPQSTGQSIWHSLYWIPNSSQLWRYKVSRKIDRDIDQEKRWWRDHFNKIKRSDTWSQKNTAHFIFYVATSF